MAGQKDDGPGGLAAAVQHTAMYKGRRSIPDRSSIFYSTASYRSYHSAASIPWTNFLRFDVMVFYRVCLSDCQLFWRSQRHLY